MNVELLNHSGDDLSVVNAARVSFNKESHLVVYEHWGSATEDLKYEDRKLIGYLADHGHYSPFGHCFASFRCSAPIFVARQLVKHKFLRWNEVSRRYVSDDPEFYSPTLRSSTSDKKQGSGGELNDHICDEVIRHAHIEALKQYKYLLKKGVCEEQARMILPQSTMTEWIWSGSLDAFADMCNLRCKEDTQHETQTIANRISSHMRDLYPCSWLSLCGVAK